MEQSNNTTKLQEHLRWALEELDRYVTIGGDGVARNRCEGQVVDGYTDAYSAAKKALQPIKFEVGCKVWINYAADDGLYNEYIGEATLLEREIWEDGPNWRVSIPGGDDESWFPESSITPLL
jgi:hypothetical protein